MLKKIVLGCLLFSTPFVCAKQNYKGMTKQEIKEAKAAYEEKINNEIINSEYNTIYQLAQSGNVDAKLTLADSYRTGNKLQKNNEEAEKWYKSAEKEKPVEAKNGLFLIYSDTNDKDYHNLVKAEKEALFLAKKNILPMMVYVAESYRVGRGTPVDYKKYLYWSLKVSNTKIPEPKLTQSIIQIEKLPQKTETTTIQIEKTPEEIAKDLKEEETKKQIKQLVSIGQYNVAKVYYHGLGKEKNYKLAYQYFVRSSDNGNLQSQYELARLLTEHTFDEFTDSPMEEAAARFQIVIENSPFQVARSVSKYQLSKLYKNGLGVEKNIEYAKQLKDEAAKEGFKPFEYKHVETLKEVKLPEEKEVI